VLNIILKHCDCSYVDSSHKHLTVAAICYHKLILKL